MQSNRATVVEGAAGRRNFLELLTVGSLFEMTELVLNKKDSPK